MIAVCSGCGQPASTVGMLRKRKERGSKGLKRYCRKCRNEKYGTKTGGF